MKLRHNLHLSTNNGDKVGLQLNGTISAEREGIKIKIIG